MIIDTFYIYTTYLAFSLFLFLFLCTFIVCGCILLSIFVNEYRLIGEFYKVGEMVHTSMKVSTIGVMHLLLLNSSLWLEVGLSHPHKVQEFIESTGHCRLQLVKVFRDFTNR